MKQRTFVLFGFILCVLGSLTSAHAVKSSQEKLAQKLEKFYSKSGSDQSWGDYITGLVPGYDVKESEEARTIRCLNNIMSSKRKLKKNGVKVEGEALREYLEAELPVLLSLVGEIKSHYSSGGAGDACDRVKLLWKALTQNNIDRDLLEDTKKKASAVFCIVEGLKLPSGRSVSGDAKEEFYRRMLPLRECDASDVSDVVSLLFCRSEYLTDTDRLLGFFSDELTSLVEIMGEIKERYSGESVKSFWEALVKEQEIVRGADVLADNKRSVLLVVETIEPLAITQEEKTQYYRHLGEMLPRYNPDDEKGVVSLVVSVGVDVFNSFIPKEKQLKNRGRLVESRALLDCRGKEVRAVNKLISQVKEGSSDREISQEAYRSLAALWRKIFNDIVDVDTLEKGSNWALETFNAVECLDVGRHEKNEHYTQIASLAFYLRYSHRVPSDIVPLALSIGGENLTSILRNRSTRYVEGGMKPHVLSQLVVAIKDAAGSSDQLKKNICLLVESAPLGPDGDLDEFVNLLKGLGEKYSEGGLLARLKKVLDDTSLVDAAGLSDFIRRAEAINKDGSPEESISLYEMIQEMNYQKSDYARKAPDNEVLFTVTPVVKKVLQADYCGENRGSFRDTVCVLYRALLPKFSSDGMSKERGEQIATEVCGIIDGIEAITEASEERKIELLQAALSVFKSDRPFGRAVSDEYSVIPYIDIINRTLVDGGQFPEELKRVIRREGERAIAPDRLTTFIEEIHRRTDTESERIEFYGKIGRLNQKDKSVEQIFELYDFEHSHGDGDMASLVLKGFSLDTLKELHNKLESDSGGDTGKRQRIIRSLSTLRHVNTDSIKDLFPIVVKLVDTYGASVVQPSNRYDDSYIVSYLNDLCRDRSTGARSKKPSLHSAEELIRFINTVENTELSVNEKKDFYQGAAEKLSGQNIEKLCLFIKVAEKFNAIHAAYGGDHSLPDSGVSRYLTGEPHEQIAYLDKLEVIIKKKREAGEKARWDGEYTIDDVNSLVSEACKIGERYSTERLSAPIGLALVSSGFDKDEEMKEFAKRASKNKIDAQAIAAALEYAGSSDGDFSQQDRGMLMDLVEGRRFSDKSGRLTATDTVPFEKVREFIDFARSKGGEESEEIYDGLYTLSNGEKGMIISYGGAIDLIMHIDNVGYENPKRLYRELHAFARAIGAKHSGFVDVTPFVRTVNAIAEKGGVERGGTHFVNNGSNAFISKAWNDRLYGVISEIQNVIPVNDTDVASLCELLVSRDQFKKHHDAQEFSLVKNILQGPDKIFKSVAQLKDALKIYDAVPYDSSKEKELRALAPLYGLGMSADNIIKLYKSLEYAHGANKEKLYGLAFNMLQRSDEESDIPAFFMFVEGLENGYDRPRRNTVYEKTRELLAADLSTETVVTVVKKIESRSDREACYERVIEATKEYSHSYAGRPQESEFLALIENPRHVISVPSGGDAYNGEDGSSGDDVSGGPVSSAGSDDSDQDSDGEPVAAPVSVLPVQSTHRGKSHETSVQMAQVLSPAVAPQPLPQKQKLSGTYWAAQGVSGAALAAAAYGLQDQWRKASRAAREEQAVLHLIAKLVDNAHLTKIDRKGDVAKQLSALRAMIKRKHASDKQYNTLAREIERYFDIRRNLSAARRGRNWMGAGTLAALLANAGVYRMRHKLSAPAA